MLSNLQNKDKHDYDKLASALENRFSTVNQTELYRATIGDRKLKSSATIPELVESIRYLGMSIGTVETLVTDDFVDALPDFDMRLRIQQATPLHLNDAILVLVVTTVVRIVIYNVATDRVL